MATEKEFLNKLNIILNRPGVFGIQKVEDISIVFLSEIFVNGNKGIEAWSSRFSDFVIKHTDSDLRKFPWWKIIRLYSGGDMQSVELFKDLHMKFTGSYANLKSDLVKHK